MSLPNAQEILSETLRNASITRGDIDSTNTSRADMSRDSIISPIDEALVNRFVIASPDATGSTELLPPRLKLTHDQVMRRRMGFSNLTSTEEFRATYIEFDKALSSVSEDTAPVPHLPFDDVVVDTPARVIQRAIDREVEQYRVFLDTNPDFHEKKKPVSYEMLPELGASVPSIVDLEEPMADIKRERYHALLVKPLPAHHNMFSPQTVTQDIAEVTELSKVFLSNPLSATTAAPVRSRSRPSSQSRQPANTTSSSDTLITDSQPQTQPQAGDMTDSPPVSTRPSSAQPLLPHYMAAPALPGPPQTLPSDQVLLRAIVYDGTGNHKLHEVLLLPQQPLTVLRDIIRCPLDATDAFDALMQVPVEVCHARYQRPPPHDGHAETTADNTVESDTSSSTSSSSSSSSRETHACCSHGVRYGAALDATERGEPVPPAPQRQLMRGPWRDETAHYSELRMTLRGKPVIPPCLSLPHPSGFFFIEDVFYDDMRAPTAIRLSDSIVAWCAQKQRHLHSHLGPFTQKSMEKTTFSQLRLRLGSHYLYQHQGECKHTIVFSEMRVLSRGDVDDARMYPLVLYSRTPRQHRCGVCKYLWADWITYNDKLAAESPAFFCRHCFDGLHKDEQGRLLYQDFSVFPILPMMGIHKSNYVVMHS